ncbi:hypothetical protein [Marinifilum sp.]|uniref:hypothetical protein n=1 Tax=Marinifilum sp. TaxID=2033137 RepID=UPI003BAADE17
MKKKILLSLVGAVCFGFLFSYNLVNNNRTLKADNIDALATEIPKKDDNYKFWSGSDCEFAGSIVCYIP